MAAQDAPLQNVNATQTCPTTILPCTGARNNGDGSNSNIASNHLPIFQQRKNLNLILSCSSFSGLGAECCKGYQVSGIIRFDWQTITFDPE
jgi:hypothetical protein